MNPSQRILRFTLACGLVLTWALSSIAFAQKPAAAPQTEEEKAKAEAEAAAAAAEEAPVVTEEITVTSRLREETLQEVPFSIIAPTEEVLRARGAENLEGVAANVPGFTVQSLGQGQSQVAMRGVSAGQIVRDQPGVKEQVGMYLDDSVISLSLFTPDIDLFDMSRVEVLRGPQGTLFGSGSLSGTLRYITNQPELGSNDSVAEFSLNSVTDGDLGGSAKAAINVPFGDTAAMRFTGFYTSFGGFIDAIQPDLSVNENYNSSETFGGRLAFRFEPNDQLTITPRVTYQEVNSDGRNQTDLYNILGNPFTTTRPQIDPDEREQVNQFDEPFSDKFLLADLNIGYDFGSMMLTSITSYTDRDILAVRDAGALTASITGGSIGLPASVYTLDSPLDDATTATAFTQELRLAGGNDTVDWLGGVFYSKSERDYAQSLYVGGFQALTGIPTQGLAAPVDVLFFSDLSYEFEQIALFGEVTFKVSENFNLTGGLRYYDFEESRKQIFDGIFGNDNNGTSLVSSPGSTSADGIVPRVIADFQLTDTTSLNAQVSQGFRLGGINDPLNVPLCTPQDLQTFGGHDAWEDETLWNYEVGSKSTIMGGKGTFNVAAFYMDITDLQATVTAGSCSSRVIFNVPSSHSAGLEFEFAAAPTDNWDFSISASYADSKLDSTLTSTDSNGNVSIIAGIEDGNRLPTVPKFQAVAALTYQWKTGSSWLGYTTGTYQYVGSRFTQIGDQAAGFGTVNLRSFGPVGIGGPFTQNTFTFDPELPAYDLINLRLGFLNQRWDVAVFVNNVTDENARLALDQERGTRARVGYLTNQPRTFGVSTRVHF
ncbi:MAG: TonB-dependent receptor [Thermoanaerobaculia bacterium]